MRNTLTGMAVGLSLGAALAFSSMAFAQNKGPTISKNVGKPLQAAQAAMNAKKYPECISKAREADAAAGKTPYDDYAINQILGFCSIRVNDLQTAARSLELTLNSEYMPQDEVQTRVRALSQVNYQLKNYAKAIEYGNRAVKGGFADADMYTLVGQAYYIQNDFKTTQKFISEWVSDQEKRGQKPREGALQLLLSSCIKLEDSACVTRSLERLVSSYPKDEYWQNLMQSLLRSGATDKVMLNIYRLAAEVNAMRRGDDYTEMAQIALDAGSPGEAQAALEQAIGKKLYTEQREVERNNRLLAAAKVRATEDRATLAKQEKEAQVNKTNGELDVKLGQAYLSYGQYPQAVAAIQRGIAEGKLKNLAEAQILLGISQMRAGNKAEAVTAFKAAKGDDILNRLAALWALRAQ